MISRRLEIPLHLSCIRHLWKLLSLSKVNFISYYVCWMGARLLNWNIIII